MPFAFMFSMVAVPIVIILLAALGLTVWMAKEYFALPGHFDVSMNLLGQKGTVKTEITPHRRGKVYVAGAYWDAISQFGAIPEGKDVEVVEVREKFLVVKAVDLTRDEGSPVRT